LDNLLSNHKLKITIVGFSVVKFPCTNPDDSFFKFHQNFLAFVVRIEHLIIRLSD
jgi:hypothetical protein